MFKEFILFRFVWVCVAMVFLLGCSSKKEKQLLKRYSKKMHYHAALQKTEKLQLYKNDITKTVLTATYLQKKHYNKHDRADEKFIITLDVEDEIDIALHPRDYLIRLNGHKAIKIQRLSSYDSRLNNLSFVTSWGSYYLLTFSHIEGKEMKLFFQSKRYGKGVLKFAKVSKYLL